MSKRSALFLISAFAAVSALAQSPVPLAQRIGHYDPAKTRESGGHGGGGGLRHHSLGGGVSKGVLDPKSSIAAHFHIGKEEMFIILDGEAEFTINGRTSRIKGPAAAPCRIGYSHAIYNPTDKPLVWMNVSVSLETGSDATTFNLGDDRKNVTNLDPIPQFISTRFDPKLLEPVAAMDGGKGTVQYRRAFPPLVFATKWSWVDHMILPPGTTVGARAIPLVNETYFVMSGQGTVTIGKETAPIKAGDAVVVNLNEARSLSQTGTEPLEFMIIGVATDLDAKVKMMKESGARAGGRRGAARATDTEENTR